MSDASHKPKRITIFGYWISLVLRKKKEKSQNVCRRYTKLGTVRVLESEGLGVLVTKHNQRKPKLYFKKMHLESPSEKTRKSVDKYGVALAVYEHKYHLDNPDGKSVGCICHISSCILAFTTYNSKRGSFMYMFTVQQINRKPSPNRHPLN